MCIPVAGKHSNASSDKATETVYERKRKQRGKECKSRQSEGIITVDSWENMEGVRRVYAQPPSSQQLSPLKQEKRFASVSSG